MKIFNLFIAIIIALFFASCGNKSEIKHCELPDLYLAGEEGVYKDTTEKWELREKKVLRWDSLCGSDSVLVKYNVKTGITVKEFPYIEQGKKVNLDSLVSANNCNTIGGATVGPVNPPNRDNNNSSARGGEDGNGGFFSGLKMPEELAGILSFLLWLIVVAVVLAILFGLYRLLRYLASGTSKRSDRTSRHSERISNHDDEDESQQQNGYHQFNKVEKGKPATRKTVMPDGSIIIPAALGKLKKEEIKIHITREYYEDGTEKQ